MPGAVPETRFTDTLVLRDIMEGMGDGCFACDAEWRVIYVNPAAERLLGIRREDVIGHTLWDALPPVAGSELERELRGAASGEVRDFAYYHAPWRRWFRERCFPLAAGGLGVCFEDVTEARRTQAELRSTEERYRELVECADSAILRWSRDGTLLYANDCAQRLFGWDPGELVGRHVSVLLPGGESPEGDLSRLFDDNASRPGHHVTNVDENVRKDGSRLWVAWTSRTLHDDEGAVAEVLAVGKDVTALVEAQEAQGESEERLTLALAVGGLATWDYQLESGRVSWNDEHFRMLGYEAGEVEPSYESFHARVHPDDAQRVSEAYFGSLERGGDYEAAFRALLPDGSVRWIDARGHLALAPDGAPRRSYGVMVDVTEHRQAGRLLLERGAEKAAQAERDRLARDLHDSVTQALFAASLKAEALTLSGGSLSPETARTIEELRRLSRGALAQMRTMLLELRSEPLEGVPLRQLLRNLAETAESRASISVAVAVRGEAQLRADVHVALYRIAEEALNNVSRHARAKRAWVELDLGEDGTTLVVGDDGAGFTPEAVDAGHLGLRSMRERADEVGARLDVLAGRGKGTLVEVVWPAR